MQKTFVKVKRHYLNEIQDTLFKDAVRVQKGANSHLQSTANIAVCRHHFLANVYLLSTVEGFMV